MNPLQPFQFENAQVRAILVDDEPWVVASDVAVALDYSLLSNPGRLFASIPDKWKGVKRIHTLGGEQNLLCLSESGLYFFLARSDKAKAFPFQEWIAESVVPSIRKTGSYSVAADPRIPQTLADALQLAANLERDRAALESRVGELEPKAEFADAIAHTAQTWTTTEVAKMLGFAPRRFISMLERHGWYYRNGKGALVAAQPKIDAGYLVHRISKRGDGEPVAHPEITGAGLESLQRTAAKWGAE